MKARFIDRFDVILLDMGNTFMFNGDRFKETDQLDASYRKAGGSQLSGREVFLIVSGVFQKMVADGKDPNKYEIIDSVANYLKRYPGTSHLSEAEFKVLEQVISEHEIGVISSAYISLLKELRKTHRLGIISDICSSCRPYYQSLERAGIRYLFDVIIFSSEVGTVKPSPNIFLKAACALKVPSVQIVYIGDSLRRDIAGANGVGMGAVWISHGQSLDESIGAKPDLIINDLWDILKT